MVPLLFLLISLSICLIYFQKRKWGGILLVFTLILGALLFWYHITDTLPINL